MWIWLRIERARCSGSSKYELLFPISCLRKISVEPSVSFVFIPLPMRVPNQLRGPNISRSGHIHSLEKKKALTDN